MRSSAARARRGSRTARRHGEHKQKSKKRSHHDSEADRPQARDQPAATGRFRQIGCAYRVTDVVAIADGYHWYHWSKSLYRTVKVVVPRGREYVPVR
jgi:hypothetical protein